MVKVNEPDEEAICRACDGEGGDQRTGQSCRTCRGTGAEADAGYDPDAHAEAQLDEAEEREFHAPVVSR